jgi:hypothetical protein
MRWFTLRPSDRGELPSSSCRQLLLSTTSSALSGILERAEMLLIDSENSPSCDPKKLRARQRAVTLRIHEFRSTFASSG